jgi:hypothetical protein
MSCITVLALLAVIALRAGEEPERRLFGRGPDRKSAITLGPLLSDPAKRRELAIHYETPQEGMSLSGNGSLFLEFYPSGLFLWREVLTCTTHVSPEAVQDLLHTMVSQKFFDLPEQTFVASGRAMGYRQFHRITVGYGWTYAERVFEVPRDLQTDAPIPQEFSAVEEVLQQLKSKAFSPYMKQPRCQYQTPIHSGGGSW